VRLSCAGYCWSVVLQLLLIANADCRSATSPEWLLLIRYWLLHAAYLRFVAHILLLLLISYCHCRFAVCSGRDLHSCPARAGARLRRSSLYQLFHLLNHLLICQARCFLIGSETSPHERKASSSRLLNHVLISNLVSRDQLLGLSLLDNCSMWIDGQLPAPEIASDVEYYRHVMSKVHKVPQQA
jgi:hypothetical protein